MRAKVCFCALVLATLLVVPTLRTEALPATETVSLPETAPPAADHMESADHEAEAAAVAAICTAAVPVNRVSPPPGPHPACGSLEMTPCSPSGAWTYTWCENGDMVNRCKCLDSLWSCEI